MQMPLWSRAKSLRSFALDHGYATAEFAVLMPAVVLVGAVLLWVFSLVISQFQIQSASYAIARNLARGQQINILGMNKLPSSYQVQKVFEDGLVTVKVTVHKPLMNQHLPLGVELSAISSAQLERGYAATTNATN